MHARRAEDAARRWFVYGSSDGFKSVVWRCCVCNERVKGRVFPRRRSARCVFRENGPRGRSGRALAIAHTHANPYYINSIPTRGSAGVDWLTACAVARRETSTAERFSKCPHSLVALRSGHGRSALRAQRSLSNLPTLRLSARTIIGAGRRENIVKSAAAAATAACGLAPGESSTRVPPAEAHPQGLRSARASGTASAAAAHQAAAARVHAKGAAPVLARAPAYATNAHPCPNALHAVSRFSRR